jgi:hypothetical protein
MLHELLRNICIIFIWIIPLQRAPLSLVSTIEELLGRKRSGSGPESREYGRRDLALLKNYSKKWQIVTQENIPFFSDIVQFYASSDKYFALFATSKNRSKL